jgi:hypothetical protein
MGLTNFPNGVSSFGIPVFGSGSLATTGNVFFVDSGSSAGADGNDATSPEHPAITLDAAVGKCTANNGDVIFVMPGHAESIPATDITMDVAGVSVIGLGRGDARPTFTFAATGSTIAMSAASTRLSNVVLVPGIGAVAAGITASGVASEIDNVEFKSASAFEFTDMIRLTGSRSIIRDCKLLGLNGTAGAIGISLNGCDQCIITRNIVIGQFSTGCIENVTTEALQVTITHNTVVNQDSTGTITMHGSATGTLAYNSLANESDVIAGTDWDTGDLLCNENYFVNTVDEHGIVVPQTASTS